MNDEKKTRKQLIEELNELRQCIAELKGFEEEIKQTRVDQEKFTKAFLQNSIPVGITTLKDGRFVDVSDAFLRLMGRKRDEVIGHTSVEIGFITKEQRASFFEELNKRGRVENLEMEVGTKGGALKYGLFNAVLMSTNNEKYLLAVMIDITDRKLMEKALAEEHQRLLSILDGSPVSSFVIDRDRKVTAWNMVNEFFTGLSKGDMLGKPLDLSPLYKDRVPPALADLVHEMSDEEIMKRYGHKGIRKSEIHPQAFESIGSIWIKGKERIMAIQATRLRDAAGSVIGAIQCAQDITTQKWSEEKLRKSEEKYRNLFENAAEGIYQVSPEGRFISVNPAAARMLGYESPEELIDTITDIGSQVYAYPEDRDKALALLKKDGFFRNLEVRNRRKNGSLVWILANVRVVQDDQGNILYHEGTSSDITEQRNAKDTLERLVTERTAEVSKKNKQLVGEVKKSKSAEDALRRKGRELHLHSVKLQQLNSALKVLLKQRDEDRRELEEKVLSNVKHLITPSLEILKKQKLNPDSKTYLDILESNLMNIVSPFSHTLFSKYQNLTPTEIKVANMIINGKTTKEMADLMGVSANSINHHRYHIRNKLGILTQKINLRSCLSSFSK
jgi:PAS domain S-box-containing protein